MIPETTPETTPRTATVGIAQWLALPGQPAINEATAASAVRDVASQGCDVVVLPELRPCGYDPRTRKADAETAG
jgi:predicted amidohydrolase